MTVITAAKLCGAVCLVAASLLISAQVSRAEREKIKRADGLSLLLHRIKNGIVCSRTPLLHIYEDFSDSALDGCGFTAMLRREGLLAAAESGCLGDDGLSRITADFARLIGSADAESEGRLCDACIAALSDKADRMRAEYPKHAKLRRTLSAAASVASALLFI